MTLDALILLAALVVIAVLVLLLLLRRPPGDPAVALLLAAQERQGERLGALTGETRSALSESQAATARTISELTTRIMEVQAAAAQAQQQGFAALEKSVLDRLTLDAAATQQRLTGTAEASREALDQRLTEARDRNALNHEALRAGVAEQLNATREKLAAVETALLERLAADAAATQTRLTAEAGTSRTLLDAKLKEMAETSGKQLAEIQKSVNEQLAGAVEKQMNESFQRVIDQFAAIQQMMGNVQSVATQVGDLKRLFGNIKTRGGWGEAQLKAMLDDFIGPAAYETNVKLREGSNDMVEFAIIMPGGDPRARLPLDAKFPSEDYERLMLAHEAGDLAGEAQARRAIETRIRTEAAKIKAKYICPPVSTEYAILFLPTEGLYAEVARIPGLIDDVARGCQVFIAGPSLLPAMLKTVQLGYVSFALSQNAQSVGELLAATKTEMGKMDQVLEKLGKQVGNVSNTIGSARVRTKAIARKLRGLETLPGETAEALLEIAAVVEEIEEEE
ncbi:MAG: DNA recombination protein RmuC [Rubritepida sp.]|nr:DNA recombination protein RmuC [Rubritepida sp.]